MCRLVESRPGYTIRCACSRILRVCKCKLVRARVRARCACALCLRWLQLFAMRMLQHPQTRQGYPIYAWGTSSALTKQEEVPNATSAVILCREFRMSLQSALCSEEPAPWHNETAALPPLSNPPDMKAIELYALDMWNIILYFLLGYVTRSESMLVVSSQVRELLIATRLLAPGREATEEEEEEMEEAGSSAAYAGASSGAGAPRVRAGGLDVRAVSTGPLHITRAGYSFLLKDTSVQLWTFMNEYLASPPAAGIRPTDILTFLLELGFCRVGEGFAVTSLTPTRRMLLADFATFGLLAVCRDDGTLLLPSDIERQVSGASVATDLRFFPTSLGLIL
ncbi:hypothetical protein EON66_08760, partial [archaeon]